MDHIPSTVWMPDQEMEEPCDHIMKQNQHTYPDYYTNSVDSLISSESFKDHHPNLVSIIQPIPQVSLNGDPTDQKQDHNYKATKSSSFAPNYGSLSSTFTISFGNPTSPSDVKPYDIVMPKEEAGLNEFLGSIELSRSVRTTRRNHRQAQEHVLSERKRREKLAQRFMSLSALLPGLQKLDKATVLEDASKYIIQLQNRVKELEETSSCKGKDIIRDSKCCVNYHGDHHASCLDETKDLLHHPEIKVRISGGNILVRIYCREISPIILKTLKEMERLQITRICCSVLPFSNTTHAITITAQMSEEMVITTKYLVKCLQSALSNFP